MDTLEIVAPSAEAPASVVREPGIFALIAHCFGLVVFAGVVGALMWLAVRRPMAGPLQIGSILFADPFGVVLSGSAPVVLAMGAVSLVHYGYPVVRGLRWKWRKRREGKAKARGPLARPVGVHAPEEFEGVDVIDVARKAVSHEAPMHQGAMYRRGVSVAVLPALAVLLAALPELRHGDTAWAVGSAVAQVFALVMVIVLIRRHRMPADAWVAARIRDELLRREQYLRLAKVGPYLNLAEVEAQSVTAQRLVLLGPGSNAVPETLVPARDGTTGVPWIDELWSHPPAESLPHLSGRARTYLFSRIDKQRWWFQRGEKESNASETRIGRLIGWSLIFAIAVGVTHAVRLVVQPPWFDSYTALATLLMLVLPPLAAVLIALRELYMYRARSASYSLMVKDLDADRKKLSKLINRIEATGADQTELSREFQRFVLHLEAALTLELQAWIMITRRDEFAMDF